MVNRKSGALAVASAEPKEEVVDPKVVAQRANILRFMASPKLDSEQVVITPDKAMQWLDCCNTLNRSVSVRRVADYAREMKAGRWLKTHQGIAFGKDGSLYDGQHRLWAIFESGVSVEMMVTRGMDEDARPGIDKGRIRSIGDELQMFAGKKNGNRLFSVLRALAALLGEPPPTSQGSALDLEARFKDELAWGIVTIPPKTRIPGTSAPVVAAMVLAHRIDPRKTAEFARQVMDGEGLHSGDPALTLRRYFDTTTSLTAKMRDRSSSRNVSLRALRCVLAHIDGEPLETTPPITDTPLFYAAKRLKMKLDGAGSEQAASAVRAHEERIKKLRAGK